MNRQAQAVVMFLVGAVILHAGFTDLYLRYVKAELRPLLLVAGAVLMAGALAAAWYEFRGRRGPAQQDGPGDTQPHRTHEHGRDGGDEHDHRTDDHHGHREPRVMWLLLIPLLALILVAPPALGSYSAMRAGTALQEPYGYSNLPASDPLPVSLVDYAGRAVYDHGRSLDRRKVRITGFVALDTQGAPYLVRMSLNCCAADAQPVKLALTGDIPPVLEPDTWLRVTGTYTPKQTRDPVNNRPIPYVRVIEAVPVPAPRDPYDESWNQ
ncbi:TIGR03943 family protein [Streptomyces sp. Ru71]|uniref:TIGR03943 family putative permease subunit n=1 Tax=Streptomyces sp. Ru71 TaxID=2080746 RepID=UPI000CDD06E2|nr:TIGR03943 family protein [Streptomyces sp. Ru71]POX47557.1 TIGR03943 family protein [Streptomyces sp. Ru71]